MITTAIDGSADAESARCEHIFVYGTLMGGHASHPAWPAPSLSISPACVAGVLLDLGPYPAMVPPAPEASVSWVLGEVHRVTSNLSEVLASLDAYEEFRSDDPAGSLYLRRLATAVLAGGELQAWAYYLNNSAAVAGKYPVIEANCEFNGLPAASWRVRRTTQRQSRSM